MLDSLEASQDEMMEGRLNVTFDNNISRHMPKRSSSGPPEVDALIEQIKAGDPRAFGRLVAELEPFVSGSSLKVCRDREIANENVQDTFINVYRKLHQFDGTSKFTTWIYSIIVNNCRMKRRRGLREETTVSASALDPRDRERAEVSSGGSYAPERSLLLEELQTVLGSAIESLPVDYRTVFVLRDIENHSNEDVAESLGLSVAAVKSRLHRARARVRTHMEKYLSPPTT